MVTLLTNESPTLSSKAGDARVADTDGVMPTYKAMPKWKAYVMVSGRGLSLSGFKDGSRGGVVDSSMKAKTVLEDSLNDKPHERSQLEHSTATLRLGSRSPCESLVHAKNTSQ